TDGVLLPADQAVAVEKARQRVEELQKQLGDLQAKKPPPADLSKEVAKLQAAIAEVKKSTPHYHAPIAAVVDEARLDVLPDGPHATKHVYKDGEAQDVAVQVRGNPGNLGAAVPRRFLSVLSPDQPKLLTHGSGRLDLAQALVTEAAPLAARVFVNRVWKHHFGTGLVETPSDFGMQGERPSHPQLLDDLAARFIQNGWSLKWLHREIL